MLLGARIRHYTDEERRLTEVAPGVFAAKNLPQPTPEDAVKNFFDPSPLFDKKEEVKK